MRYDLASAACGLIFGEHVELLGLPLVPVSDVGDLFEELYALVQFLLLVFLDEFLVRIGADNGKETACDAKHGTCAWSVERQR